MIMIDYPQQARLKILGRVKIFEGQEANDWIARLGLTTSRTAIERVFEIHVEAFDWNCQQHITPRYTAEEIREAVSVIEDKLQSLEAENAELSRQLAALRK